MKFVKNKLKYQVSKNNKNIFYTKLFTYDVIKYLCYID